MEGKGLGGAVGRLLPRGKPRDRLQGIVMDECLIAYFAREMVEQLDRWGAFALDRTEWAERFRGFGFQMDCGNSYQERYGLSIDDVEGLRRNLEQVVDIQILGNAVFSQCRYITHWALGGCERELEWLHLALKRLEELAEEEAGSHAI